MGRERIYNCKCSKVNALRKEKSGTNSHKETFSQAQGNVRDIMIIYQVKGKKFLYDLEDELLKLSKMIKNLLRGAYLL